MFVHPIHNSKIYFFDSNILTSIVYSFHPNNGNIVHTNAIKTAIQPNIEHFCTVNVFALNGRIITKDRVKQTAQSKYELEHPYKKAIIASN